MFSFFFVFKQGDTNVPVLPSNVLEMMRHHLEQKDSKMVKLENCQFKVFISTVSLFR